MQQREKHECNTLSPIPIVLIHQIHPAKPCNQNIGKGFCADNLAFVNENETLLTTSDAKDVYQQLSFPDSGQTGVAVCDEVYEKQKYHINKWLFWKAVVSGCLLAASIIILFLWIQIRYVSPMLIEVFKISPPSHAAVVPKISAIKLIEPARTQWKIEYDVPMGIPVLKLHAKELLTTTCPQSKFALALHLEYDSEPAEDWLKACGHNVAYFRIDGNTSSGDVDRLIVHLKETQPQYLPLKAMLNVQKGGDLIDNPDFQKTRMSDQIIRSIEISGYVTSKIIEEVIEAVPYAEELSIVGGEVCKSLGRSLKLSDAACQCVWEDLQKLHIFNAKECRGMYDLIYSCWNMPKLEILQIRNSMITSPNSNYIRGILDRYRMDKVDFADNTCFDDTLSTFPFMCQSSKL